ncbi:hypothetical protein GCM10009740_10910 [Terrabacter terrae]|uniref:Uncharacterized protein n=1 Tax=Terrabacter terrae TaxID=318434 RepID=A0ABN2TY92_9MICO
MRDEVGADSLSPAGKFAHKPILPSAPGPAATSGVSGLRPMLVKGGSRKGRTGTRRSGVR